MTTSAAAGPGRPRVVLVSPGFPPARGGVEEHVGRLAAELRALGVGVTVLAARRGLRRMRTEQLDGGTVQLWPAWRTTSLSLSPRLLWQALRVGREADVLHVHSYHALTGLAVLNRRLRGRVVFTPHYHGGGHSAFARLLHLAYGRLGGTLFGAADQIICVSQAERQALTTDVRGVQPKIQVIPNGVTTTAIRAARPYPDQPPTVLTVGRLEPYKGVADVIVAMAQVVGPAQLVIVGDGSQRDALAELVAELGLQDRVRLLGPVDTPELHRWLRTAQVLVSASTHEAFGMAPLEAAAAGARVVLSDIPAHREIVEHYLAGAALLVDSADPAAWASAIDAQLSAGARVEVDVPSWAQVAAATLQVYARLEGANPAGARTEVGTTGSERPR